MKQTGSCYHYTVSFECSLSEISILGVEWDLSGSSFDYRGLREVQRVRCTKDMNLLIF